MSPARATPFRVKNSFMAIADRNSSPPERSAFHLGSESTRYPLSPEHLLGYLLVMRRLFDHQPAIQGNNFEILQSPKGRPNLRMTRHFLPHTGNDLLAFRRKIEIDK